ncbi:MAG: circularly permuted type 2 ATP-grasp protein, partial [Chromatiales bacterium]
EIAIREMGISFTVYTEGGNIDRAWPFDIIPRIIELSEWRRIEDGLKQRLTALNLFINDVYNKQEILKEGIVPADLILKSRNFLEPCKGVTPPYGVWANICGSDLVRDGDGEVYVLEDNLRVPSGVSYMIENRQVTKRVFPELFEDHSILPVDEYTSQLFEMLASLSPRDLDYPEIAVLTPGIYNSAYFEHSFLAQGMAAELVEGSDLFVGDDDCVYMRTVFGPQQVDVIYRRIDDIFCDPEVFRKDSILGVPGLIRAWRAGKVAIANAPGSGVADDKVVYAYVPEMIRYYLDQDPILPNVPTWLCEREEERAYVLDHLDELVVKPANESGGYGMLVGPHSTEEERKTFSKLITENPRNYIAQPTLSLSTAPTLTGNGFAPRHLDLRPFILQGESMSVTAGGLTRVAMREGSLVVNSSQGGGSKDTWIVDMEAF